MPQGTATAVPYGGGKVLTFEDDIDKYSESKGKDGSRVIEITTDNDEDVVEFRLTVFENGRVDLQVSSRNRESISYNGQLNTSPEE